MADPVYRSGDYLIAGNDVVASISSIDTIDEVVEHDWFVSDWSAFDEWIVTQDAAQAFTYAQTGNRGRFTGTVGGTATAAGPGSHRSFMVRDGTYWEDSEITSLWWGPNVFGANPTRRPQLGHVHRAQKSGTTVRGMVAWMNIFGGPNPESINLNLWETVDQINLTQGTGGTQGSTSAVNRSAVVGYGQRINAFDVAQLRVASPWAAAAIPNGAVVSVTGMTDTTFNNPASVAIASGSRTSGVVTMNTSAPHLLVTGDWVSVDVTDNVYDGLWQVTVTDSDTFTYVQQVTDDASAGTGTVIRKWTVNSSAPGDALVGVADLQANDNVDKTAGGILIPEYPWRVFPYWVSSRLVGNTLSVKQWAYGAPEPEWGAGSVHVGSVPIAQGSATGLPSGRGLCGVVAAHAWGSDYGEYGNITFRKR